MENLHLITVCESAYRDVIASGACLTVTIGGQSFFTGNEAFKKAEEVARCVAALGECGISTDQIHLQAVSINVDGWLLIKSSSASYHLQIECPSLDQLGGILAALAGQKHCQVDQVSWRYQDLEKTKNELLRTVAGSARVTAGTLCDALSVSL